MRISMIAAMSKNRVIGRDNDLPWHLPDDFQFFKDTTKGHHLIMGRKNYESLPPRFRPLPDRINLILTRNSSFSAEGTIVFQKLNEAIEYARESGEDELFIIGGGEIFKMGLEVADRIYLTEIDAEIEGDVFFPQFDNSLFRESFRKHHSMDDRHAYAFDFVTYDKQ